MSPDTIEPDPLAVLRTRTRAAHDALESTAPVRRLMSAEVQTSDVERFLSLLLGFYTGLENRLGPALTDHPLYRTRKPALTGALAGLGARPSACEPLGLDIPHPDATLGLLYTVEGSSLGAIMIDRHLSRALGTDDYPGAAYFRHFGADSRPHWTRVVDALRRELLSEAAVTRAADGALAAFQTLYRLFSDTYPQEATPCRCSSTPPHPGNASSAVSSPARFRPR